MELRAHAQRAAPQIVGCMGVLMNPAKHVK